MLATRVPSAPKMCKGFGRETISGNPSSSCFGTPGSTDTAIIGRATEAFRIRPVGAAETSLESSILAGRAWLFEALVLSRHKGLESGKCSFWDKTYVKRGEIVTPSTLGAHLEPVAWMTQSVIISEFLSFRISWPTSCELLDAEM